MRHTRIALVLAGAALLLIPGASRAQMTVTNTATLDFGSLIPSAGAGTVVISPTGGRTTTGGVTGVAGTFGPGAFQVAVTSGSAWLWVGLPTNATLSSGGSTMTVSNFTRSPGGFLVTFPSVPGSVTVSIGATLTVGANQPAGLYTGTYSVNFWHF